MVKAFLLIFLLLFAVAGICELIYILKMLFYYPGIRVNNYALVFLKKDYALKQLNFIWQKIKWQGDGFAVGIVAITDELDTKEIMSCNKFIKDKNITLYTNLSLLQCEKLQGELFDGYR